METLGCIIVDDDEFSTTLMRGLVRRTQGLELRGEYSNAIDALNALRADTGSRVRLIFLDIEMPEMSGIDFVKAIGSTGAASGAAAGDQDGREVIIYSSQEKYALESYEYDVCDYLLKPVTYARFIRAVGKARQSLELKVGVSADREEDPLMDAEGIFVRDNKGEQHNVRYCDIVSVEARENYVTLRTTRQKLLLHVPMRRFVESLPEEFVVRTHRSYAAGKRFIVSVGKDKVTLSVAGQIVELPLSRSCGAKLKQQLGLA